MTLHRLVNFSVVIASSLFAIEQPNEERIGADCGPSLYRVGQMVVPLGLFDSDFYIPSRHHPTQLHSPLWVAENVLVMAEAALNKDAPLDTLWKL